MSVHRWLASQLPRYIAVGSHQVWAVAVDDSAERHSVTERRGHVRNLHVPVALRYVLAPLLQAPQSRLPRHGAACSRANTTIRLQAVGGVTLQLRSADSAILNSRRVCSLVAGARILICRNAQVSGS